MFSCSFCNYFTDRKYNFTRHNDVKHYINSNNSTIFKKEENVIPKEENVIPKEENVIPVFL